MRVVISVDNEGISGIVSGKEVNPGGPDYNVIQHYITGDVNAAISGAVEAGAESIVVHDSHGLDFRNVLLEDLNPLAELIRGQPVIFFEGLDESFDACFLIGYHARSGQPGILSHVLNGYRLRDVRINGQSVGEGQISAALAGHYGIPTVLVTGDDLVCKDMKNSLGDMETAIVKYSLSRYAARCLPLSKARGLIKDAAKRSLDRLSDFDPFTYDPPIRLEVDWDTHQTASYVAMMPQVKHEGLMRTSYTTDNFPAIYRTLLAMFFIATSELTPRL